MLSPPPTLVLPRRTQNSLLPGLPRRNPPHISRVGRIQLSICSSQFMSVNGTQNLDTGWPTAGTVWPAGDTGDVWRYLGDVSLGCGGVASLVRGQEPHRHLPIHCKVPQHRQTDINKDSLHLTRYGKTQTGCSDIKGSARLYFQPWVPLGNLYCFLSHV